MIKPLVSVIIPVYNADRYLAPAIDSIIGQSLGFLDNIEIIFVNDGSTDDSGKMCEKYRDKYPNNIIYIEQENHGVSTARNAGLKHARGEYINFFDADDIWDKHAFKKAVNFLASHVDEVDFVAAKLLFFDGSIDSHPTNYKFNKTRVIDIVKDPDNPILHLVTCVFKRSAIGARTFDTKLKIAEDAKFLAETLKNKKAFGVLSDVSYNYRKHSQSAIGGQWSNKDFYTTTPELAYKFMLDLWRLPDGSVEKFMQYEILSDLKWRVEQENQNILSEKELKTYKQTITDIIRQIDDNTITTKRGFSLNEKLSFLKLKYGQTYDKHTSDLQYPKDSHFTIEFITSVGENRYKVEGFFECDKINLSDRLFITTSRGAFEVKSIERKDREKSFLGSPLYNGGGFEVIITTNTNDELNGLILNHSGKEQQISLKTNRFTRVGNIVGSYTKIDTTIFKKGKNSLKTYPDSTSRSFWLSILFGFKLIVNWNIAKAVEMQKKVAKRNLKILSPKRRLFEAGKPFLIIAESVALIPEAITIRTCYFIYSFFQKKSIWLISDRGMAAGDSGETLFNYILQHPPNDTKIHFVLSKKSSDFKRLKSIGSVVDSGSIKHKVLFLLADKIISSHADIEVTNPFLRQIDRFVDLMYFDFIFLQHGVIRHDLSKWLNRFEKNISLFVTSAEVEKKSIIDLPYYYQPQSILLSGLPRFDDLNNNPQKKLILAPTYRKNIAERNPTDKNGSRRYDPEFKNTNYFQFYDNLINNKRLQDALKKNGVTGEFYLHPAFAAQTIDFTENEQFKVQRFPYDYKKAFNEGSLLVSDYSSVVFDFAYLKKPVIYTHFDSQEFYASHSYSKGDFFTDNNDGFGPVTEKLDELIDTIIKTIESGCVMDKKYRTRVENFFAYNDHNNSKRVFEAITEHDKD